MKRTKTGMCNCHALIVMAMRRSGGTTVAQVDRSMDHVHTHTFTPVVLQVPDVCFKSTPVERVRSDERAPRLLSNVVFSRLLQAVNQHLSTTADSAAVVKDEFLLSSQHNTCTFQADVGINTDQSKTGEPEHPSARGFYFEGASVQSSCWLRLTYERFHVIYVLSTEYLG